MGEKIKELRLKKLMSQDDLAKAAGVSRVTISSIERGRRNSFSTSTLNKIGKALGVTVDYFFE